MDSKFWYVYMLQSIGYPERYYVGLTEGLGERINLVQLVGWLERDAANGLGCR